MKPKAFKFSLEYLKEALTYDPKTGQFTWNKRPLGHFRSLKSMNSCNTRWAGKRADSTTSDYATIFLCGETWQAHRVAVFYFTGIPPVNEIDHINRNKKDNRFENLRECDRFTNLANCGLSVKNKSGSKGVHWNPDCRKWSAKLKFKNKLYYLGVFEKLEDAIEARTKAETIYYAGAI
jgi:hypothetical protein